jgi:hypothetical protein
MVLPLAVPAAGYAYIRYTDGELDDLFTVAALPAAAWMLIVSRNRGAKVVAYAMALTWVYENVVTEDEDISPMALVVAIAAAFVLVEGVE